MNHYLYMKTHRDEFARVRKDAEKVRKVADKAIDVAAGILALVILVTFIFGTLSLA